MTFFTGRFSIPVQVFLCWTASFLLLESQQAKTESTYIAPSQGLSPPERVTLPTLHLSKPTFGFISPALSPKHTKQICMGSKRVDEYVLLVGASLSGLDAWYCICKFQDFTFKRITFHMFQNTCMDVWFCLIAYKSCTTGIGNLVVVYPFTWVLPLCQRTKNIKTQREDRLTPSCCRRR